MKILGALAYFDGYYGDDYASDYFDQPYVVYQPYVVSSDANDAGYCAQRYKSDDPPSGTYLGYDGLRHPCS
jgi:hypothetical protein